MIGYPDGGPVYKLDDPNYQRLADVLERAHNQASKGKGEERHANGERFEDQPMQIISGLLDTDGGMAFQAIKKIQEARRLPTRERRVRELLGAINYVAGMIIFEEDRKPDLNEGGPTPSGHIAHV
ncbi:hypothetical protein ACJJIQ_00085 (plasmid) [Microbulbifer sp. ANSA003]|uniref:hypothetical protein n=1 Tax=Microbulbifer sp. ANSA003 TaxID=3243360 RepID=UPI0040432963